jgi:hypothetical protein
MANEKSLTLASIHSTAKALTAGLLLALAACGGGSGSGLSAVENNGNGATGGTSSNSADTASTSSDAPTSSSAAASFFNSIFLKDSGSGFYQFDANYPGSGGYTPVASGRTRFYVDSDSDDNFIAETTTIAGAYTQDYETQLYITAEGAFTSRSTPYIHFGSNSKIFQKLSQGYELGMRGMSTALERITIKMDDVSGLPISDAIRKDEGPAINGLPFLLAADKSPMPKGSIIYQLPYTVVTTHLWANLTKGKDPFASLEEIQARTGGAIQSLGGYRYLQPAPNSMIHIEYDGALYHGELVKAGDIHDVVPAAYNSIAADFIAQREAVALAK